MPHEGALGRRLRSLLLAALAVGAILLGIAGMHASMAGAHHGGSHIGASMGMPEVSAPSAAPAEDLMAGSHGMGDMNGMDCLLLGLMCFVAAVAVVTLLVRITRLRAVLRPRAAAQSLRATLARLRPPVPPSLHALSISRT